MVREFINKRRDYVVLVILSLILLLPLINIQLYQSHDGPAHVARIPQYVKAFEDHQFPPRWPFSLNYTYGTPALIMFYPLGGYISAFFNTFWIPYAQSFVLTISLFFILGPLFFYMWLKEKFPKNIAFIASVFYTLLPYRFLTTHVRGGVGELIAFSLLPLVFFFLERWSKSKDKRTLLYAAGVYALVVLGHNAISLLFTPIILLYFCIQGKRAGIGASLSVLGGLLLSAYFWIPSLVESKYTSFLFYFKDMYKEQFPPLLSLVYSAWGFGPDTNRAGGLSPQIGPLAFVIVAISLFFAYQSLLSKKEKNRGVMIIFWVLLFVVGIVMSTSLSGVLWERLDYLKKFQFPWRFNVIPTFAAAALFPYVMQKINKKVSYAIVILALILALPMIRVKGYMRGDDSYFLMYSGSSYFRAEGTTIWSGGDPNAMPKASFEVLSGDGNIHDIYKTSMVHKAQVDAKSDLDIVDNTMYFPGWKAYLDNKEVPIQFQDPRKKGIIEIKVPPGNHTVVTKFTETKVRIIADILSLLSVVGLLGIFLVLKMRKKGKKKNV